MANDGDSKPVPIRGVYRGRLERRTALDHSKLNAALCIDARLPGDMTYGASRQKFTI